MPNTERDIENALLVFFDDDGKPQVWVRKTFFEFLENAVTQEASEQTIPGDCFRLRLGATTETGMPPPQPLGRTMQAQVKRSPAELLSSPAEPPTSPAKNYYSLTPPPNQPDDIAAIFGADSPPCNPGGDG